MGSEGPSPGYARLGFVATYTESISGSAFKIADSLYKTTRAHTPLPSFVDARVKEAESKVTELGVPLLNFVQDRATHILAIVDVKLDQGVGLASDLVNSSLGFADLHFPQMFKGTRDVYVARAMDLVKAARQQSISGTITAAKEQTIFLINSAKQVPTRLYATSQGLLNKAGATFTSVRESLSVEKAMSAVGPTVDLAKQKYEKAHEIVVTTSLYHQAYGTVLLVGNKVQAMPVFQNVYAVAVNRLYPTVSPYTTPLVEKAQPYIDTVFDQLKPVSVVA